MREREKYEIHLIGPWRQSWRVRALVAAATLLRVRLHYCQWKHPVTRQATEDRQP